MATELTVPQAGESVTEGRIARWMKKNGQAVKVDEPVFELETDKASLEVSAPVAGVLSIRVKEGEMVKVGQVVGTIDPAGTPSESEAPAPKTPAPKAPAVQETRKPAAEPREATAASTSKSPARPLAKGDTPTEIIMSPAARAIVGEKGYDPAQIPASGPGGRLTKEDVLAYTPSAPAAEKSNGTPAAAPAARPAATGERETRQPISMIRKRIAQRLLESQNTTATLTTFNEADMTAIQELRAKHNEKFEKKHGVKLGFMSVFVKAAVEALKAFPLVNARIDGNDIVQQHFYDIGVAVSTEKGLMVPVIRNADQLSFAAIEKAIGDVAKRARDSKITPQDMMGGTFTITNGGIFGSMLSTPILNPPQTAILGMHSIQKRPVVVNDQIVIRPMMYLALSYDHRLIDGREAVQFLVRIKECVEQPERMLLEI